MAILMEERAFSKLFSEEAHEREKRRFGGGGGQVFLFAGENNP